MAGDPRKHGSKCYTKEASLDVYEISKYESPQNMDIHWEGSDVVPRPEASMHRNNEAMKGIQSKASTERSKPFKLADEHDGKGCDVKSADEHGEQGWDEACLEKPDGNQGMNNDGRGGGDGWGSALDRGCPSNKRPSNSDPPRQCRRNPSPRRDRNTSQRNKRRRSRSRSRERSRGRTCWDFAAGRCWRGLNCKFRHEDGSVQLSRPFQQEHYYPAGATEWYGYQSSCRAEEEARQSGYAYERFGPGSSSYGSTMMEHRRVSHIPCKFFVAGHCRYGANCQYLHETAAPPESQMGLRLQIQNYQSSYYGNAADTMGRRRPQPSWWEPDMNSASFMVAPISASAAAAPSSRNPYWPQVQQGHPGISEQQQAPQTSQMMPPTAAAGAEDSDDDSYSIMSSMSLPAAGAASTAWAQQGHGHPGITVHPTLISVPPQHQQQQVPLTSQMMMPPTAGAGGAEDSDDDGYSIMLMTLPGAAGASSVLPAAGVSTVLQAAVAEKNKKSDNNKDVDAQATLLKPFKFALAEFAKEALKPTWRQGRLSKEDFKTVVKKVVDKVINAEKIPPPKDKIDAYITLSKDKLNKLVQEYVARFARA